MHTDYSCLVLMHAVLIEMYIAGRDGQGQIYRIALERRLLRELLHMSLKQGVILGGTDKVHVYI